MNRLHLVGTAFTKCTVTSIMNAIHDISFSLVYCNLALIAGLLTFSPFLKATALQLPPDYIGTYEEDWPIIDPIYHTGDGNSATTDYFFEWVLVSMDSSNDWVDGFSNSVESWMPLDTSGGFGSLLFPAPGTYAINLSFATFHQEGGLPGCGPHTTCYDFSLPFTGNTAGDEMIVTLNSVPAPTVIYLISIGLLGVIVGTKYKAA